MATINIYIIHYTKLVHREGIFARIQNAFTKVVNNDVKLNIKNISKFDPDKLDNEFVKRIFDAEDITDTNTSSYNKYLIKSPQVSFISNCLKHMDALNQISKTSGEDDINIIIEDDVVFDDTMEVKLMEFVKYDKQPYDIIFFGMPGQKGEKMSSDFVEVVEIPASVNVLPCCDSYFITKKCAKTLAKAYIPLKFPNNIQLSYLIAKNSLKVGKTFPNIMADGSKIGVTPSSISPNNILIFNSTYKEIYKTIEKTDPTHEDIEYVKKMFKENELKNTPDFLFLEGLFNMRIKKYLEAKSLFDKAITLYEDGLSPLSNQSAIIHNYIDLCKHVQ